MAPPMRFVVKGHLGGFIAADRNYPNGDPATWCPGVWQFLRDRYLAFQKKPWRVLDVGCGEGHALEWFADSGCDAKGVEGLSDGIRAFEKRRPDLAGRVVLHDYTKGPLTIDPVELVWSCEFVEHVAAEHMPNFLATFADALVVAMTHAEPGQGGHHHVNCREAQFWIEQMANIGFGLEVDATIASRKLAPDTHWARSGQIFTRISPA